jgi:uncharacterized protein
MNLDVTVKTGKQESKVIKNGFADYEVWVKARPVKGAANKEVINVLADYFSVRKNDIRIVRGLTTSKKIIELIK